MDEAQNPTSAIAQEIAFIDNAVKEKRKADVAAIKTDWRWQHWIDYRALNGTIIVYDEKANTDKKTGIAKGGEVIKKMSMQELAGKLGVNRDTLYDWENQIPDFWDKVRKRQKELASQRRLSLMNDKFYIHAMTWENPTISLKWLEQNNPDWKDPRFKVEHTADDSFAALLRQMEADKAPEQKKVIEATIIPHEPDQPNN